MAACQDAEKKETLDDLLSYFSVSGRYHLKIGIFVFIAFALNGIYFTNHIFATKAVGYRCAEKDVCNRSYVEAADSESVCFVAVPSKGNDTCSNGTGYQLEPCTAWVYDEPDSFVAYFNLGCREWERGMVGSAHSFGYMIGLLIVGPVSDRIGRKNTVILTGIFGGIFGFARSFVTNFWIYVVLEFLEACIGDICSPMFMLMVEMVSTKNRPVFLLMEQMGIAVGGALLPLAAWLVPYWRHFLRVIYAPSIVFLLYIYMIDESPRWLLNKGKRDEAVKIFEKMALCNNITLDQQDIKNINTEDETKQNLGLCGLIKSTFKSKIILGRFLICVVWWNTCTFTSYGLTLNSVSIAGNHYVNYALTAAMEVPASIITIYALKHLNRKKSLIAAFFVGSLICLTEPFVPQVYPWLTTCVYMAGKGMSSLYFNITYVYTSELFPTHTRNSMHALCSALGRFGSLLAQQTPLLMEYWVSFPSFLFGGVSFIAAMLTFLMPDTSGNSLPDTVKQAEEIGHDELKETKTKETFIIGG